MTYTELYKAIKAMNLPDSWSLDVSSWSHGDTSWSLYLSEKITGGEVIFLRSEFGPAHLLAQLTVLPLPLPAARGLATLALVDVADKSPEVQP